MKVKQLISLITATSLIIASASNALACTALMVTDINGNGYYARTTEMPFTIPIDSSLTYMPADTKVESLTPSGTQGKSFGTKYAILGMTIPLISKAKLPLLMDGINDQGLSFSSNAMVPSSPPPVGNDSAKILSANDFGVWVLGNHKSIPDVKASLLNGNIEVWLPKVPMLGNLATPLHYAMFDKSGNGLVVEFVNNKMNVHDNPVGAMTNGPEFTWHLQNLNNYTFSNVDKNAGQLGKLKLATPDAGIALTALPSAQTSQGRFVKAAFYSNYVKKGKTPDEAVNLLAHIINNFDRPMNLTVDNAGSAGDNGGKSKTASSEVTQWTVMGDLSRNRYYVRTIDAMNWSVVDMNQLKGVTQIKSVSTYAVDNAGANAFTLLVK